MFKMLILAAALATAYLIASDDGMATCQQTHSYDTCFHSLNR